MKNKFNIPVVINDINIIGGNYIDHLSYKDLHDNSEKIVKRRIISKDINILIKFGISLIIK